MRIRRKKHLEERIKNVSDILYVADFDIPNSNEANKDKRYIDFVTDFGNDNPLNLEIGCGKGLFSCEMAKRFPNENFIAVELLNNIIVMACERCKQYNVTNLRFFNSGAEYLPRYIKDNSISKIFLNFSPPFPGDRYENRRLTCDRLMSFYDKMLKDNGEIRLKTDDKEFFEYSQGQMVKFGFMVKNCTELLDTNAIDNVQTEYEIKFRSQNVPIYYFIARKSN